MKTSFYLIYFHFILTTRNDANAIGDGRYTSKQHPPIKLNLLLQYVATVAEKMQCYPKIIYKF